jgi:hypothetical protein
MAKAATSKAAAKRAGRAAVKGLVPRRGKPLMARSSEDCGDPKNFVSRWDNRLGSVGATHVSGKTLYALSFRWKLEGGRPK